MPRHLAATPGTLAHRQSRFSIILFQILHLLNIMDFSICILHKIQLVACLGTSTVQSVVVL